MNRIACSIVCSLFVSLFFFLFLSVCMVSFEEQKIVTWWYQLSKFSIIYNADIECKISNLHAPSNGCSDDCALFVIYFLLVFNMSVTYSIFLLLLSLSFLNTQLPFVFYSFPIWAKMITIYINHCYCLYCIDFLIILNWFYTF